MGKTVTKPLQPKTRKLLYLLNAILLLIPLTYFGYPYALKGFGYLLIVDEDPTPSDAIIVLAGGEPGRALKAAELFKAQIAPRVVLTTETPPEIYQRAKRDGISLVLSHENYVRILEGYGVPAEKIIRIENPVGDTYDEMLKIRDFAQQKHWTRVTIVTSNFHTRRSRLVARYVLEGIAVAVVSSPYDGFRPDAWWTEQSQVRTFAIEMEKLLTYSLYIWPRKLWKTRESTKPQNTSQAAPHLFSTRLS